MKYFLTPVLTTVLALTLAACSAGEKSETTPNDNAMKHVGDYSESNSHDHGAAHDSAVTVTNAMLRPPLPGRSMAAAYFTLSNHGAADRLISVESPISERVEIHTHLNEDGVMKMRKLDSLDLAPGETAEFKPGGHHIMLFDVTLLDGETGAMLTLNFENAGPVMVVANVMGRGEPEKDDHSGH